MAEKWRMAIFRFLVGRYQRLPIFLSLRKIAFRSASSLEKARYAVAVFVRGMQPKAIDGGTQSEPGSGEVAFAVLLGATADFVESVAFGSFKHGFE